MPGKYGVATVVGAALSPSRISMLLVPAPMAITVQMLPSGASSAS